MGTGGGVTQHLIRSAAQAGTKKTFTTEQWEGKLAQVQVPKEDMNALIMNFLVTEVGRACGRLRTPCQAPGHQRGCNAWLLPCCCSGTPTPLRRHRGT